MVELAERIRNFQIESAILPLPGCGSTPSRHQALIEFGRTDLSLARIAEAHTDAVAILAEAGFPPPRDALYGVWASDGPKSLLQAEPLRGQWRLQGTKQYCSGATFCDAALVTAHTEQGLMLFDVPLDMVAVRPQPSTWESPAFADTATVSVTFDQALVGRGCLIGGPNWYLSRPGFWHGAIGPAACWAGGALSLIEAAADAGRRDPHSRAHLGALQSSAWAMRAMLEQAGREIDSDPADAAGRGRVRALMVRHLIERTCADVLDRFGRATGPQQLAYNAQIARQHVSLALYIRQCHAERDLEAIPC